jgi:hypothetical protein
MMLAPLPSLLVDVHAVVFLSWIILFATQISGRDVVFWNGRQRSIRVSLQTETSLHCEPDFV